MCGGPASGESAVEVGPEVFDVLAADAEPRQRGWQVLLTGDGGAAFDGGFDRAETRGVPDDLQGLADGVRTVGVAVDVEGDHGPVAAHEASGGRVRRMRREAGVADQADVGVAFQPGGELVSGGGCALEAQVECRHAADGEVTSPARLEWHQREGGASAVVLRVRRPERPLPPT
jgi:hypothetical protein